MRTDRREGQIWIDREAPYNLRYFVNKTEYTVAMAASYDIGEYIPHSGNVVTLKNGKISPAVFPDDIENVIGVVASNPQKNDEGDSETSNHDGRVEVIHSGYIEVKADDGYDVFVADDKNLIKKTIFTKDSIVGAPVYWFIGREDLDIDQEAGKGMLTLGTPCGFLASKDPKVSKNVDYDNLPQIGNIVKVDVSKDDTITTFYIHLNFSRFDSSIEWMYPKKAEDAKLEHDVLIAHGLFPKKAGTKRIESFADTTVDQAGEVFNCIFPITNVTSGEQLGTKVYAKTDSAVSIKVHGQVSYIG